MTKDCPFSSRLTCTEYISLIDCKECFVYMFMQPKDGKVAKARNHSELRFDKVFGES